MVVNKDDKTPYDPRIFDVVIDIPNRRVSITVKTNIDNSLAGDYELELI